MCFGVGMSALCLTKKNKKMVSKNLPMGTENVVLVYIGGNLVVGKSLDTPSFFWVNPLYIILILR